MSPISNIPTDAAFIIFLVILLFLGLIRTFEGERFKTFLRSLTNLNLIDQQLRQERAFSRLAILLFLLVMTVISAYLCILLQHQNLFTDFSYIGLFVSVFIALAIFTTLRVALYSLLAWVFKMELLQQHHTFHWLLTNVVLSLLLIPVSVIGLFGPPVIQGPLISFGLWLLLAFYLLRVLRVGYISSLLFRVPLAYNFLYICALEILPLCIAVVFVSRQVG